MIFAELRGKLSSDYSRAHERGEDLLTSTVFGFLRYFSLSSGHLAILNCIHRIQIDRAEKIVLLNPMDWIFENEVGAVETTFWQNAGRQGHRILTCFSCAGWGDRLCLRF